MVRVAFRMLRFRLVVLLQQIRFRSSTWSNRFNRRLFVFCFSHCSGRLQTIFSRTAPGPKSIVNWNYIAQDNSQAADNLLDEIDARSIALASSPYLGAARPDIAPELRHSLVGRYLILYRIIPDGVQIVRVIHGARRLSDLL